MQPMIAIHDQPGSFSDRWVEYCSENGILHKLVNCRDTRIIEQLVEVDGLLWNWKHDNPEDQLIARQVLMAVEQMGIEVFPNALTSWHYDDKIAQKYLLEAIHAPLVPTYVFIGEKEGLEWIAKTTFPKVFKLRCGAGSSNVSLVKTREDAVALCSLMFGKGRTSVSGGYFSDFHRKVRKTKDIRHLAEKVARMLVSMRTGRYQRRLLPVQRGYLYFQDYLAGNDFDTRVTVIGGRAFAFLRMNRPGDFRASGSGLIVYDVDRVDPRCIRTAFEVAKRLHAQSLSFDFIFDRKGHPRIVEISYTYVATAVNECPGYWGEDLNWHEGHFWPQDLMVGDLMSKIVSVGKNRP